LTPASACVLTSSEGVLDHCRLSVFRQSITLKMLALLS